MVSKMKYFDFKEEASFLQEFDATEMVIFATIVAILMANNLSTNEKNSVGNFFIQIGQTLLTIASQENLISNLFHSRTHIDLEKKLNEIERELNLLKNSRFNKK